MTTDARAAVGGGAPDDTPGGSSEWRRGGRGDVILETERLTKHYGGRRPATGLHLGTRGRPEPVRAVEELTIAVHERETLALVGESGCGKSTTARLLLRLEEPTSGAVRYRGRELAGMSREELKGFRRRVQLIFQDPYGSLNPRMSVGAMLGEVLGVHRLAVGAAQRARVAELLALVGLDEEAAVRYPHEFSGGQRQRIGIARALAVEPELIVADEPVSALDVSIQAQVLNLLADLQRRLGLAFVFIAHDLAVVRQVSDRVAVMYRGRIVELARAEELYARPLHPYTSALLRAVPRPRPTARRERDAAREQSDGLLADLPAPPGAAQSGCPYFSRCDHPERDETCLSGVPALDEKTTGRFARCFKV